MPDREKATNLIRELQRYEPQCTDYFKDVIDAVIELLKDQEPIKPMTGGLCGQCGCRIYQEANYCHNCGKAVQWSE